jgi:hypothetical protein
MGSLLPRVQGTGLRAPGTGLKSRIAEESEGEREMFELVVLGASLRE